MLVLLLFAFLAGIVTVLSPCILPVLPIVLSGSLTGGKKRPFGIMLGFILSFTFFTVFSFALFKAFGISSEVLRLVAVVVLGLFGASLFLPHFQEWMEQLMSKIASKGPKQTQKEGFGGGVIVGLSLGLFWTPCVGPILASVITLAATSAVTLEAILITLSYAIGTALPMFFIIYSGRKALYKIPWVTRNVAKIQKIFGVLMVLLAVALYLNLDRQFQTFILDTFPQYGVGLTKLEENEVVRKQLDKFYEDSSDMPETSGKDTEALKKDMQKEISGDSFSFAPNPEFQGAIQWLNSEPLTLQELRGKVVLIDFWTYSCINCIRTLPYITSWHEKYKDEGLVIIGVHTPEFEFERSTKNVQKAMKDYDIVYPVVQDNDYKIWRSYQNRYWPAKYFIDKNGKVRRTHFGEGKYQESEEFIRMLLKETGADITEEISSSPDTTPKHQRTPESYLGYDRLKRFVSPENILQDQSSLYSFPENIPLNNLAYSGEWTIGEERAMPSPNSHLKLHFEAQEVYLVMSPQEKGARVQVFLDDEVVKSEYAGEDVQDGIVTLDEDRLYRLIQLSAPEQHSLTLEFLDSGIEIYAFTFG